MEVDILGWRIILIIYKAWDLMLFGLVLLLLIVMEVIMDIGGLIYISLIIILDLSKILKILLVLVMLEGFGLWSMLLEIIWEILIRTLEEMFPSTHQTIITAIVSSVIKIFKLITKTEYRTVGWQVWLISNKKMIGFGQNFSNGLGI